jgi:hypothetical protein
MDVMYIWLLPRRFIVKRLCFMHPSWAFRLSCWLYPRGPWQKRVQRSGPLARVKSGDGAPGQLCIYPKARVGPGRCHAYSKERRNQRFMPLKQPVVPVATNGRLLTKRGVYRKPGTAVFQFRPDPVGIGLRLALRVSRRTSDASAANSYITADNPPEVEGRLYDPIADLAALLGHYDRPGIASLTKTVEQITPAYGRWIAASRLVMVSSRTGRYRLQPAQAM